jgi:peptidyl-prolyl cis-trans isomerase B (cyclophilin B)
MKEKRFGFGVIFLAALAVLPAAGCGGGPAAGAPGNPSAESGDSAPNEDKSGDRSGDNPIATIEMENGETVEIELYPDVAPNTVRNFIALAAGGFYDGTIFHRVIPGFMIQGGDPDGTGAGGPGYRIFGEFANNDFPNDLKHTRGVISMARQGSQTDPKAYYDTAGSQFFIMVADSDYLDGDYAAFGAVVSGMEAVDAVVSTPTDGRDKPLTDQRIKTVRIDTRGVDYAEPETLK